jgi:uncharacterized membrane protein
MCAEIERRPSLNTKENTIMAKTVIGLFDTASEAEHVVQSLTDYGFSNNEISVVANDARGEYGQAREVSRSDRHGKDKDDQVAESAGAGAVGGTVIGGTLGLLVGAGMLTIPGIGPVLAAGPIAAALGSTALGAGIGAAAGGLVGSLVGLGVPEDEADYYAEGVRRGGTLVSVSADGARADQAYEIMQSHGAVDIKERGSTWRDEGWTRFDPAAEPYDASRPDYARGQRRYE